MKAYRAKNRSLSVLIDWTDLLYILLGFELDAASHILP